MKNFEIPLKAVENGVEFESIALAHNLLNGMQKSEYFEEAPDIDPHSTNPVEFFDKLGGDNWETRREKLDIQQEVGKIPKCYDVALAFAMGDQFERAKRLLKELLELEIAHNEVGNCAEFFDNFEERENLYATLAGLEAEKYKQKIEEDLWEADE